MAEPKRLLFVCLGNIVRSPLAEHLFAHQTKQAGVGDGYVVDSAGTAGYHVGESPDARMRQVAAANGLIYDGAARQFRREDFNDFDLILVMDQSNQSNVLRLAETDDQRAKVHLMREFDTAVSSPADVPDPYYGGIDGFTEVFKIVKRATQNLLTQLEAGSVK